MKESINFYNNRITGLLEDFVQGIKRLEDSILTLSAFIPPTSTEIADIGCGIGWSSFEFSRFFPQANVDGFDLSPVLIHNANQLFRNKNLNFFLKDITEQKLTKTYDCIVMIDVYEHLPIEKRFEFHQAIRENLSDNGRLVLACPTKFYQNWLRNNKPEGLQPVDEDVDIETLHGFSRDVGGELIYFEHQSVWNTYDYLYAVIQLNPDFQSPIPIRHKTDYKLTAKTYRSRLVKQRLNKDIKAPTVPKPPQESQFRNLKKMIKFFIANTVNKRR